MESRRESTAKSGAKVLSGADETASLMVVFVLRPLPAIYGMTNIQFVCASYRRLKSVFSAHAISVTGPDLLTGKARVRGELIAKRTRQENGERRRITVKEGRECDQIPTIIMQHV